MTDPESPHALARRQRKQAAAAATFQPDSRLERALVLRDKHPDQYAALPPSVKASLGYYLTAKAAHDAGDAA
jgi:hypothetical protein